MHLSTNLLHCYFASIYWFRKKAYLKCFLFALLFLLWLSHLQINFLQPMRAPLHQMLAHSLVDGGMSIQCLSFLVTGMCMQRGELLGKHTKHSVWLGGGWENFSFWVFNEMGNWKGTDVPLQIQKLPDSPHPHKFKVVFSSELAFLRGWLV